MADLTSENRASTLLRLFAKAKGNRLSNTVLRKKLGDRTDASESDGLLTGLIEEGLISASKGAKEGIHPRKNASYRLTEKGKHRLRPTKPEVEDTVLQTQEAYILLQIFLPKEQTLTRGKLNEKLKTVAAKTQLEFDLEKSPETVDYHLAQLVEKGCLEEEKIGNSARYTFNPENGTRALASVEQYETVNFNIDGKTLSRLLAAAYQSKAGRSDDEAARGSVVPIEDTPAPKARPLGEHDIVKYLEQLRSGKYAGKDMVPIHEVRRLVAEHHGEEASGHPSFDPLIKGMRSEDKLELIAISDNRNATQEQLDASIPGMNETIFYIVVE